MAGLHVQVAVAVPVERVDVAQRPPGLVDLARRSRVVAAPLEPVDAAGEVRRPPGVDHGHRDAATVARERLGQGRERVRRRLGVAVGPPHPPLQPGHQVVGGDRAGMLLVELDGQLGDVHLAAGIEVDDLPGLIRRGRCSGSPGIGTFGLAAPWQPDRPGCPPGAVALQAGVRTGVATSPATSSWFGTKKALSPSGSNTWSCSIAEVVGEDPGLPAVDLLGGHRAVLPSGRRWAADRTPIGRGIRHRTPLRGRRTRWRLRWPCRTWWPSIRGRRSTRPVELLGRPSDRARGGRHRPPDGGEGAAGPRSTVRRGAGGPPGRAAGVTRRAGRAGGRGPGHALARPVPDRPRPGPRSTRSSRRSGWRPARPPPGLRPARHPARAARPARRSAGPLRHGPGRAAPRCTAFARQQPRHRPRLHRPGRCRSGRPAGGDRHRRTPRQAVLAEAELLHNLGFALHRRRRPARRAERTRFDEADDRFRSVGAPIGLNLVGRARALARANLHREAGRRRRPRWRRCRRAARRPRSPRHCVLLASAELADG